MLLMKIIMDKKNRNRDSLSSHRGYFLVCVGDLISDSWTLQNDFWKRNPNNPKICTRELRIHKYCMILVILKNCRGNSNLYEIITFSLYRLLCHYSIKANNIDMLTTWEGSRCRRPFQLCHAFLQSQVLTACMKSTLIHDFLLFNFRKQVWLRTDGQTSTLYR